MELAHIDTELADDRDHQLGEQARAVGMKELVEHPAGPVVVECRSLDLAQAQQRGDVRAGPAGQGIQRLVASDQVGDHELGEGRGRDHHPRAGAGQAVA